MLILYLALLLELAVVGRLVRWRVARLERRYAKVAAEAEALLKQAQTRGGNTNRPDPLTGARVQYQLAQVALKRDRVEAKYGRWESFSERFAAFRGRLAGFKGKLIPYLVGAADVAAAVAVLQRVGAGVEPVLALLGL